MRAHAEKREAVSGDLLLTTEVNGKTVTTPAILLVRWPDQVRLEVQDPVGGTLLLLVLQGDRFWLYQAKRPEILMGPLARLPIALLPQLATRDLVRLLLARPDFDVFQNLASQDRRVEAREKDGSERLEWNRSNEVSEWSRVAKGVPLFAATYDDYEYRQSLLYPTKIQVTGRLGADGRERKILLAWKSWEPTAPAEKKLFEIPQEQTFGRKIKALP